MVGKSGLIANRSMPTRPKATVRRMTVRHSHFDSHESVLFKIVYPPCHADECMPVHWMRITGL